MKSILTKNKIYKLLKNIIFFFFIFDVAFEGISTKFSSRKIMFVCILFVAIYKYIKNGRTSKHILHTRFLRNLYLVEIGITALSIPYLIYLAYHYGVLNAVGREFPYPVYFIIFSLIAPLLLVYFFNNRQEMLSAVSFAAVAQSIFIWCEYTIWPFKEWLQEHIHTTANVKYTAADRATGLGASASALTLILAYFIFVIGYEGILEHKKNMHYWLIIFFTMAAQFLSGRIGFYISILNIGLIFLITLVSRREILKNILRCFGSCILIIMLLAFWLSISKADNDQVSYIINRNLNKDVVLSTNDHSFYGAMIGGSVPEMRGNILWGIGTNYGETVNVIQIKHDSGYVKRYIAEGVIFATLEYLSLFALMIILLHNVENKWKKFYILWMILAIFISEIKEPYIYYYAEVTIILLILFFSQHNISSSKEAAESD